MTSLKGTTWNKKAGKWQAQVRQRGLMIYLGLFATAEAAHEAFCKKTGKPREPHANDAALISAHELTLRAAQLSK